MTISYIFINIYSIEFNSISHSLDAVHVFVGRREDPRAKVRDFGENG